MAEEEKNPLWNAIYNTLAGKVPNSCLRADTSTIHAAVVAQAIQGADRFDQVNHDLRAKLEAAWSTLRRHFPAAAEGRSTIGGAILTLSTMFSDLHTEKEDETARADLAEERFREANERNERLINAEQAADAEISRLQAIVDRYEREKAKPGFQHIIKAIAARAVAANEQMDNATLWKLDQLHDAAKCMLTPNADMPAVTISFQFKPGIIGPAPSWRAHERATVDHRRPEPWE